MPLHSCQGSSEPSEAWAPPDTCRGDPRLGGLCGLLPDQCRAREWPFEQDCPRDLEDTGLPGNFSPLRGGGGELACWVPTACSWCTSQFLFSPIPLPWVGNDDGSG